MIKLRVGGVPEHFNCPWWSAQDEGEFQALGIQLEWQTCPGGSGQMMRALSQGELDLALVLSEAAAVAIARGAPAQIRQWYVSSPLLWGIHVAQDSPYQSPSELRHACYAISRPGSGSQLMAYVEAQRQGWFDPSGQAPPLSFVEVSDLAGGIAALQQGQAEVFFWERFTTQPWVDQGVLRRIGVCPTPWPAFALVQHKALSVEQRSAIKRLSDWLADYAGQYAQRAGVVSDIARRSQLGEKQIAEWLSLTRWAQSTQISFEEQQALIQQLLFFGLLNSSDITEDIFVSA